MVVMRPYHVYALVMSIGVALHVEFGGEVVVDGHDARWKDDTGIYDAHGSCCGGGHQHGHGCHHQNHNMILQGSHGDPSIAMSY